MKKFKVGQVWKNKNGENIHINRVIKDDFPLFPAMDIKEIEGQNPQGFLVSYDRNGEHHDKNENLIEIISDVEQLEEENDNFPMSAEEFLSRCYSSSFKIINDALDFLEENEDKI